MKDLETPGKRHSSISENFPRQRSQEQETSGASWFRGSSRAVRMPREGCAPYASSRPHILGSRDPPHTQPASPKFVQPDFLETLRLRCAASPQGSEAEAVLQLRKFAPRPGSVSMAVAKKLGILIFSPFQDANLGFGQEPELWLSNVEACT